MNHFRTPTATSMAATLANIGRQLPPQSLTRISTFSVKGVPISHVYLVVPNGQTQGDYWEISETNLWRLQRGMSPQEIGCELAEPRAGTPEYPADDRACSIADRLYQSKREEV